MQRFWDFALALEPPDDEVDSERFVHGSFLDVCIFFWVFFPESALIRCSVKHPYLWGQKKLGMDVARIPQLLLLHLTSSFKTVPDVSIDSLVVSAHLIVRTNMLSLVACLQI